VELLSTAQGFRDIKSGTHPSVVRSRRPGEGTAANGL
ncbi:uncharacterized protein CLUP02_02365, partial [Colletotrichum lupini]